MKCTKCGNENPAEADFCIKCGTGLKNNCPKCGAENPPEAGFCMKCGTNLAATFAEPSPVALDLEHQFATLHEAMPSSFREQLMAPADGENRLVTVLFADMSSSVATTAGWLRTKPPSS